MKGIFSSREEIGSGLSFAHLILHSLMSINRVYCSLHNVLETVTAQKDNSSFYHFLLSKAFATLSSSEELIFSPCWCSHYTNVQQCQKKSSLPYLAVFPTPSNYILVKDRAQCLIQLCLFLLSYQETEK